MGSAEVSCEPPCTCAALESIDGYEPKRRMSITRLRAVAATAPPSTKGACVLVVSVRRNEQTGGEKYVVSDLMLSQGEGMSETATRYNWAGVEEGVNRLTPLPHGDSVPIPRS